MKYNLALIVIVLFSVILSCVRINDCKMSVDEFFSINIAQRSLGEIWSMHSHPGTYYFNRYPPLYETVLHFVWKASKENLLWARLLSVVFTAVALFMIFLVGRLLFDTRTGLIGAFLASITYAYLFYSKMVRCYAFLNALSILSFYLFFRALRDTKENRKWLLMLCAVNLCILYTFYFGAFVIVCELLLSLLFFPRRGIFRMWAWLLGPFIFFLPWLGHFIADMKSERALHFAASNFRHFFGIAFFRVKEGIFYDLTLILFYCSVCIVSVAYGWFLWRKKDRHSLSMFSLTAILLFPIFTISYLTSQIEKGSVIFPLMDSSRARYFFSFIFPVFLLAGRCINALPRRVGYVILTILSMYSLFVSGQYLRSSPQVFCPAQLAPLVQKAKAFQLEGSERSVIEIEDTFFVPVFVYYFYGPRYFRGASIPYGGANVKVLNNMPRNRYRLCFNAAGIEKFHLFKSAKMLQDFDWLILIYSDWMKHHWGGSFRTAYWKQLKEFNGSEKVSLVQQETIGSFSLEIYKINRKEAGRSRGYE